MLTTLEPGANTLALLVVMGVAGYFQTVTGFGLGMIIMGAATVLHLAPVTKLAVLVSLLTLANSAVALPGKLHHVDWAAVRAATLGMLPSVVAGALLLDYLDQRAADVLQLLLGVAILYGGIGAAWRPAPLAQRSSDASFFLSGVLGGLLSGMFGVSGPPLIFQFYRQPLRLAEIRYALILVFTVSSAVRTAYSMSLGRLDADLWLQAALTLPVVALTTAAARRFPPPLSATATRRLAFAVLVLIGGGLLAPALLALLPAHSAR
nr:sulfite exporter TauE/SafE family protein [uncultured Ralstonia sp.]